MRRRTTELNDNVLTAAPLSHGPLRDGGGWCRAAHVQAVADCICLRRSPGSAPDGPAPP